MTTYYVITTTVERHELEADSPYYALQQAKSSPTPGEVIECDRVVFTQDMVFEWTDDALEHPDNPKLVGYGATFHHPDGVQP